MDFDSRDASVRFPMKQDGEKLQFHGGLGFEEEKKTPLKASNILRIKFKVVDKEGKGKGKDKDADVEALRCKLCLKTFPSDKALFGHMRCHPDRRYRGMEPPQAFRSVAPVAIDCVDQQTSNFGFFCPPGWAVRAKRSRVINPGAALMDTGKDCDFDEDQMFIGAVNALMFMSTGNDCYRYLDYDLSKKLPNSSISNKKPRRSDSASDKEDSDTVKTDNPSLGKKRKRQVMRNPDEARCYRCSICDKAFDTHQALGGHKSSAHSKVAHQEPKLVEKGDQVKTDEFDTATDTDTDTALVLSQPIRCPLAPVTPITVAEAGHICKICDKVFPSGQALGGHMRRHWLGPPTSLSGKLQFGMMMMSSDGHDHTGSLITATAETSSDGHGHTGSLTTATATATATATVTAETSSDGHDQTGSLTAETRPLIVLDLNELPTDATDEDQGCF